MHSFHIHHFDTVSSTNDLLKRAASDGAPDGTLYIADRQTAGRGRMGRSFFSPGGTGLYMSLLLRGDSTLWDPNLLTPQAAVAVAEALDARYGTSTGIKWVNDIYLHGRKICGILCESISVSGVSCAVIGIGINLSTTDWPEDLALKAGSLAIGGLSPADRQELAVDICGRLTAILDAQNMSFMNEYRRRSILIGNTVDVYPVAGGPAAYSARVLGIDGDACLRVVDQYGTEHRLFSGEVSVRGVSDV